MKFQLPCSCGQSVTVGVGHAGSTVQCACGRDLSVPSLSELRRSCQPATIGEITSEPQHSSAMLRRIGLWSALGASGVYFGSIALQLAIGPVDFGSWSKLIWLLIFLAFWLGMAVAGLCWVIGKGFPAALGLVLGIIGPIGWLAAAALPNRLVSGHSEAERQSQVSVPDNRREAFVSTLIAFGILVPPLLWWACWLCLTGPVYREETGKDGKPLFWSPWNKIAAVVILTLQAAVILSWIGRT